MQIPNQLNVKGIKFVLLEKGGKRPFQKDWTNKNIEFDSPELLEHLNKDGNYGVMGGGEKNLVIVDFDNEPVQGMVLNKLPATFTVKTGRGLLHLYYFVEKSPESFKGFDEQMNTLFDVQGTGKQVVGPGCLHPNGNYYTVIKDIPIENISYSELKAILMPFDRKPKKEVPYEKPRVDLSEDFIDKVKNHLSMRQVLDSFGVDTSRNPSACLFHASSGGKCLGFNTDTAHCFHCDGSWNIFSLVKQQKNCSFYEALQYLANLAGLQDELEVSRQKYIDSIRDVERDEKKGILAGFLELMEDEKPGEATEIVVNWIKRKYHIYTTRDDVKPETWIYVDGIYIPQRKFYVKEILRDLFGIFYNMTNYNKILAKLEADTAVDAQFFFNHNYIDEVPVKNGILNLRSRELKPFTHEKIFFNKLPVEYDSQAKCPKIEKFVTDVLATEDDKDVFYEMGGFCLWKEYKFEKAFMLVGNGRNGKDKTLELIKRLLGVENCCSVPLASIVPDSFIISEFHNRMANLAGEISNQDLKDATAFKALTGRSLQSAPRKFLKPVTFVNFAKFIFACNELPMVYEHNKGFWDRWVVLEYPFTFVTAKELQVAVDKTNLKLRDESIIEQITTPGEMSGLLNKFLDGLDRLNQFRTFSCTKGSDEIKKLWIRKSNSCMAFCMDKVEEQYDSAITKKEFRKRYTEFCKAHKINTRSDLVIKRTIEELFGASEGTLEVFGKYERCWEGIQWKHSKL
jgi:P4 family phage/plasmid primase-like protien